MPPHAELQIGLVVWRGGGIWHRHRFIDQIVYDYFEIAPSSPHKNSSSNKFPIFRILFFLESSNM